MNTPTRTPTHPQPTLIEVKTVALTRRVLRQLPIISGEIRLEEVELVGKFDGKILGKDMKSYGRPVLVNHRSTPFVWRSAKLHLRPEVYDNLPDLVVVR